MGHDWRFLPLSSESEEVKPPPQSWQHLQSDDPGQAKRPSLGRDWQNRSTAEPQKSDLCGRRNDWKFLSLPELQQQATTGPAEVTSKRKQVSITASHWAEFAVSAKERKLSVYEENGMNLARIQGAIKSGRSCKNGCMKHVTADEVNSWCKAFHMADDEKRRLCIYSLYHPDVTDWHAFTSCQGQHCANPDSAANQKQDRFSLHVNGQSMCVQCFCSLLGIGRRRFYKLRDGDPDLRTQASGQVPKSCPKQDEVDDFFRDLYQSAAEPLATGVAVSDEILAPCSSFIRIVFWMRIKSNTQTELNFPLIGVDGTCPRSCQSSARLQGKMLTLLLFTSSWIFAILLHLWSLLWQVQVRTLFKLSGGICHMAHLLTCTGSTLPGMKARSQHRSLVLGPPGPGLCASLRKKVQTVRENPLPGVHFGECTRSGVMSYAHEQSLTMQNARHAMSCKPFCIASTHPHKKS